VFLLFDRPLLDTLSKIDLDNEIVFKKSPLLSSTMVISLACSKIFVIEKYFYNRLGKDNIEIDLL